MKTIIADRDDQMVQTMRTIRDEISNEIKDMSFDEERAYLDKLLKNAQVGVNAIKENKDHN